MSKSIWTLGYTNWTPAALAAEVVRRHAALCDIRFTPRSRHPQWTGRKLVELLGEHYHHMHAFGNRNYKTGPIDIVDLEAGKDMLKRLLDTFDTAILMCVCGDLKRCHRRVVADAIRRDWGVETRELWPGNQLDLL